VLIDPIAGVLYIRIGGLGFKIGPMGGFGAQSFWFKGGVDLQNDDKRQTADDQNGSLLLGLHRCIA